MSTDHLSLAPTAMAAGVEAVLAGSTIDDVAADNAVDPAELADAVDTYRHSGRAALQRWQDNCWFQARLHLPSWEAAETTFATQIAPQLDQLAARGRPWWFLRKYPCWRLRIRTPDHHEVAALLDSLVKAGVITGWSPSIYEPETAAFGGHAAMDITHDLFCADSRGVLTYTRQRRPQVGRRELSLLLIRALQRHAGLDVFEAADVFDRVAQMRPAPPAADAARVAAMAAKMQPLLAVEARPETPLFAPDGPAAYAAPWLLGHIEAGQRLREASTNGHLDRGLRAILAHVVIFAWNRLGLSAEAQGILAHATTAALLPRS